jgi:hypothetical protein
MSKSPKCPECSHVLSRHADGRCKTCGSECDVQDVFSTDPLTGRPGTETGAQFQTFTEPDRTAFAAEIPLPDSTPIGGHPGLDVYRTPDGIVKIASDEHNRKAVANEVRFLDLMEGSGFTPTVLASGPGWMKTEDLGDSDEAPLDGEAFRRNMIRLVWTLRNRNIRHGDLTSANLILRGNKPWAIDFQEAHLIGEEAPQKNPLSDSHLALYRTLRDWKVSTKASDKLQAGTADTPRIARRWGAVLGYLGAMTDLSLPLEGKRFLDLGCFQGDFVALAACEGMRAFGVDQGGFRIGENSIEQGRELWDYMGDQVQLDVANIRDLDTFTHDVVLVFSTWSYMVQDFGREFAEYKLAEIIRDCGTLFYENQLFGDGPGPRFYQTDDDVEAHLRSLGAKKVEKLITIPVTGRPASRSVFAVES